MDLHQAQGDTIIVGGGIAGLWTALAMAPRPVTVITAGSFGDGSSSWAQGGMAAAVGPDDEPSLHVTDTLLAGAALSQPRVVELLCENGPAAISNLINIGVPFDRNRSNSLKLGREAAHSRDRIVHVGGDEAGAAIMQSLVSATRMARQIKLIQRTVAEAIETSDGTVTGVRAWDAEEQVPYVLAASRVVLATGGVGGLYAVTTNPLASQGHGLALAAEAGATLRDLEFVQFHPTALRVGRDPAPLATEAIRGAGGLLVDAHGERFMRKLHPDAELAPRDVVARGVAAAIHDTGSAFLDVRDALGQSFASAFPTVHTACLRADLDPARDLLPIAPAAHYHMGGIKTDADGRTDVEGLFAVGECASTGVHGANRLASNSLLEAIVFGSRVGATLEGSDVHGSLSDQHTAEDLDHSPARSLKPIREFMADHVGILRSQNGLQSTLGTIDRAKAETVGGRLARIAASAITTSAMHREESRGAHQRLDHPETDETPFHTLLRLDQDGCWTPGREEVPQ